MFHNAFYALLKMSIFASTAVIIIIGLRLLLGRKLPKYFCHILWIFVLLRLLIPFSLTSVFSIFNVIPVPETAVINTEYTAADKLPNISESEDQTAIKNSTETKELTSISKSAAAKDISQNGKVNLYDLFPWIWLVGLSGFLLFSVYSYISAWTKLKTAVICSNDYVYDCKGKMGLKRNIEMYASDKISTPIVFGLIRPKIILPVNTAENSNESELRYIVTHELVHIKRFDNIIKILWVISLSIYWFNPIIWLGFIISQKDMEMSCDEKVLTLNNGDIRSEYASSLINLAAKQNILFNGGILAFGESNIKERIKRIMKFRKPRFTIVIITVVLLSVIGSSLLTNGNKKAEKKNTNISAPVSNDIKSNNEAGSINKQVNLNNTTSNANNTTNNNSSNQDYIVYENKKYNFTLQLPKSWKGKYSVKEGDLTFKPEAEAAIEFDLVVNGKNYGEIFSILILKSQYGKNYLEGSYWQYITEYNGHCYAYNTPGGPTPEVEKNKSVFKIMCDMVNKDVLNIINTMKVNNAAIQINSTVVPVGTKADEPTITKEDVLGHWIGKNNKENFWYSNETYCIKDSISIGMPMYKDHLIIVNDKAAIDNLLYNFKKGYIYTVKTSTNTAIGKVKYNLSDEAIKNSVIMKEWHPNENIYYNYLLTFSSDRKSYKCYMLQYTRYSGNSLSLYDDVYYFADSSQKP